MSEGHRLALLLGLGSLPGASAQTCVAAPPPVGYISSSPTAATATTVAELGTITCATGYFSMTMVGEVACDGESFVYSGCDPCHTMAHIFGWGGGTCDCDLDYWGTASINAATGVTDCTPCPANTVTASPPLRLAGTPCPQNYHIEPVLRTDNTWPSSCVCIDGFFRIASSEQWEILCAEIGTALCDMATLAALTAAECPRANDASSLVPGICPPRCADAFIQYWTRCSTDADLRAELGTGAASALDSFAALCEAAEPEVWESTRCVPDGH
eukprot:COSAG06_NODE_2866_length_6157_cov_2.940574_2_plen_271_part_00